MNEDIKESIRILEEYTSDKEQSYTVLNRNTKALRILLDYITNLQEETERQSKAQVILDNQIAEMYDYKSRCKKAIEYINESIKHPTYAENIVADCDGGKVENLDKLLNILKENKDE